jgi:hypothetical protein
MLKNILLEELHVTFFASRRLPAVEIEKVQRTLRRVRFRAALGRAVREVLGRYPSLVKVTTVISA